MAICDSNGIMTGRMSHILLAYGCADTRPDASEFKYMAATTSKGSDFSPSTVTSEADNGTSYVATLVTTSDLTINADYEVNLSDASDEFGYHNLVAYYHNEMNARRQPSLWVQRSVGATVITMYANITALSESGGTNDIITGSIEFKPADGNTVDVMSIVDLTLSTDLPATATAANGSALTIGPVVAAGGIAPYTYVWRKGGTIVSGQNAAEFNKVSSIAGDAGTYTVTVTDSATTPDSVVSSNCVVTIS